MKKLFCVLLALALALPAAAASAGGSFDAGEWVGYYATKDDTMSELVITSRGDGKLYAEAFFLRTMKMNATLTPQEDGSMLFETDGGALIGTVVRDGDGALVLNFFGGYSYNDEEASEYNDYFARTFRYEITVYDRMWYEEPSEFIPVEDDEWTGTWAAEKDGRKSTLRVEKRNGQFYMDLTFDNGYRFSGALDRTTETVMDFSGEGFFCMLTLNRKQGAVIMEEIGANEDGIYDWLEPFYYNIVEYYRTGE